MSKHLLVLVVGATGEGKSTIASLIEKTLKDQEIDVVLVDDDDPIAKQVSLDRRINALKLDDIVVSVETKSAPRTSLQDTFAAARRRAALELEGFSRAVDILKERDRNGQL